MAKILLVEDDVDLQSIYAARLEAEGYTVVTASDGEAGLASAMREAPDLIILDAMMPKIDGFDVLDMLRQTPQTEHTCIIMMTALGQDDYRKRGEALGVNRYIVKSQVSLDDMIEAVKQTLADGAKAAEGNPVTPVAAAPAEALTGNRVTTEQAPTAPTETAEPAAAPSEPSPTTSNPATVADKDPKPAEPTPTPAADVPPVTAVPTVPAVEPAAPVTPAPVTATPPAAPVTPVQSEAPKTDNASTEAPTVDTPSVEAQAASTPNNPPTE